MHISHVCGNVPWLKQRHRVQKVQVTLNRLRAVDSRYQRCLVRLSEESRIILYMWQCRIDNLKGTGLKLDIAVQLQLL